MTLHGDKQPQYRSPSTLPGRVYKPNTIPANAKYGSTTQSNLNLGSPRGIEVYRDYTNLRQWVAPGEGTTQQRHSQTRYNRRKA